MRPSLPLRTALVAIVLLAAACSGNDPAPPVPVAAGWAWAPAEAGARPLPVLWNGAATPTRLAVLPGGECAGSGSAQAVALGATGSHPVLAGISSRCTGGAELMRPVTWGDTTQGGLPLRELSLRPGDTQGSALAVAVQGSDVYAAGATGVLSPLPALWKGTEITTIDVSGPEGLLPFGCDAGVVTGIGATVNFVVAVGIAHCTMIGQPEFAALAWVFDPDLRVLAQAGFLADPDGVDVSRFGPAVSMTILNDELYSATSFATQAGRELPAVWIGLSPTPLQGTVPSSATIGIPTGIALADTMPFLSGFARSASGSPTPVIWGGTTRAGLPTADAALGIGAGEGIAIDRSWAIVAGESLAPDPASPSRLVSVPSLWDNGDLQPLGTLSAAGSGSPVLLTGPLPAWWRLPGTAASAPADWPYPGGFGEVFAGRPIVAAGSGVARAVVTVPQ